MKVNEIINTKFGRLTVIKYSHFYLYRNSKVHYFDCICECGELKKILEKNLLNGRSRSCGCFNIEMKKKYKNTPDVIKARILNLKTNETGCMIWDGSFYQNGYGNISFMGKKTCAHRVSYICFNGNIPSYLEIRHSCHLRSCVNPKHLSLGTRKDNMIDMKNAKRTTIGEKNAQSKLTWEIVREIRTYEKDISSTILSKKYNVGRQCIDKVKKNQRWIEKR